MRRIPAKIISPALRVFIKHYFKKPRRYSYKKIKGIVLPGVFFPHFTMSTKMLLQFLEKKELTNKTFLELGCGTGFVSVLAAKKGATVLASDINPKAIKNTQLNADKNSVDLKVQESDLFNSIDQQIFDYIIINPPYYPKKPNNHAEEAWFCGENFEYFKKLFPALSNYFDKKSSVYMILSEDCQFDKIKSIAAENNLTFHQISTHKKWGEITLIYQIK